MRLPAQKIITTIQLTKAAMAFRPISTSTHAGTAESAFTFRCGGVDSDTHRCAWPTESRTDNKERQADTERRIVVSRCNSGPHHWQHYTQGGLT